MLRTKIFIKKLLLAAGINVRGLTDSEQIQNFLVKCFPVTTEIELIRIGDQTDGGYLISNDLDDIEACFSPGVAETASFELELARRGIRSYLADFSVNAAPIKNELFHFEKKYLGNTNNEVYMTLEAWVKKNIKNEEKDLLLQMDIEGAEYDVLMDASPEIIKRFRIILIEFHDLISLVDPFGYKIINTVFSNLLKSHAIVHIHPNNVSQPIKVGKYFIPPTMEFTFLRRDRIKEYSNTKIFPHPLDFACIKTMADFNLPDCWYEQKH